MLGVEDGSSNVVSVEKAQRDCFKDALEFREIVRSSTAYWQGGGNGDGDEGSPCVQGSTER